VKSDFKVNIINCLISVVLPCPPRTELTSCIFTVKIVYYMDVSCIAYSGNRLRFNISAEISYGYK